MGSERAQWLQPYHFPNAHSNRRGRGKSLTTLIKEALNKNVLCGQAIPNGMDAAEFLAEAMVGHAIKGHPTCIQTIMDRVEGEASAGIKAANVTEQVVIYIPDDARDKTTTGSAGSVPVDPSGHSNNGGLGGGIENVLPAHESAPPHQNGKGLRGSDFPANGTGDHK